MARGLVVIAAVTDLGGSPSQYQLDLDDATGIALGDHFSAKLSGGVGAIYRISSLLGGNSIVVTDDLIEAETGEFGVPVASIGSFATSSVGFTLDQLPFDAPGWDAAYRRNIEILNSTLGGITGITGATGVTGGVTLSEVLDVGNTTSVGTIGNDVVVSTGDAIIGETDLNLEASDDIVFVSNTGMVVLNEAGDLELNSGLDAVSIVGAINELFNHKSETKVGSALASDGGAIDGTVSGTNTIIISGTDPFYVTKVILVRSDVVGSFTGVETVSFGTGSDTGFDNILESRELVDFTSVDDVYQFPISNKTVLVTDNLVMNIEVAATGASVADIDVYIYGLYLE